MYRQVLIHKDDRSLQRILWRKSPNEPLKTYELQTVTYGTAPASFLAIEAIRTVAKDNATKFPVGSAVILRDFYVDDLTSGANSIEEAKAITNHRDFTFCRFSS